MLKDKLIKIFEGNGGNKKKTENLIFLLIVLIITVVAINSIWKDDTKENSNDIDVSKKLVTYDENEVEYEQNSLEKKLENILSKISGVGNVDVLITYNETEELIPIYNQQDKKSTTSETDSQGGTRTIEEIDTNKEVIYQNDEIIIQKRISPKIEGAIIIATGAKNSSIKTNIIQAVEVATGLATHKIQVFEKKN